MELITLVVLRRVRVNTDYCLNEGSIMVLRSYIHVWSRSVDGLLCAYKLFECRIATTDIPTVENLKKLA